MTAPLTVAHRAYPDAMDEADTEAFDDLLDDGFALTHMTGYVQPKAEWPAQMRREVAASTGYRLRP
ncbi:nuclear transport factor 2 family protein [Streptomyces yaanensis]|uniref:Nuclear transport factor 2 family protein n=1 Tax=Streptomyces yaanensis TaxID=1142239 RepID=A0ABV7S936_9ACTN|nr:nuclear transport factor 2 family protein [Streptomyces sp. CGMCC 4.7035]WNC00200.1 nuclear transport factor 2 family protein [Streptomyces sp. CGMCC 4.7035]